MRDSWFWHEYWDRTHAYVGSVLSGEKPACIHVRQACQRFVDDMERAYNLDGIWFDPVAFGDVCWVLEKFPHVKGKWASRKELFKLADWQLFVLINVFGFKRVKNGVPVNIRRFTEAYVEVPRKNGKTFFLAGIGNYMLACDGEEGAEVYCGATSEKQAHEVFSPAKKICSKLPDFTSYYGLTVHAKTITIESSGSKFEPVIGNPGDGPSPSCGIADEFHEHQDDKLVSTFVSGMGAREQPIMFYITTAGNDMGGPCYDKRADILNILNGSVQDDFSFGIIYTIDEDDRWDTLEAQIKANPNFGVSVSEDFLQGQLNQARRSATKQNAYKTKHLNMWVGAHSVWMNMLAYQVCVKKTMALDDMVGCRCFIGIDLASTTDIASACLYFPNESKMFWRHYLPESALEASKSNETGRIEGNARRYAAWHTAGHIVTTPGNIIDYGYIEEDLKSFREKFEILEVPYDPFQATQFSTRMLAEGFPMVAYGATVKNFSEPMKKLESMIVDRSISFPDDPVIRWMFGNVVATEDKKENIYPNKEVKKNKIDGVVAAIMAVGRSIAPREEEPEPEVILL